MAGRSIKLKLLVVLTSLVIGLQPGVVSAQQVCGHSWQFVYRNDSQGEPIAGDRQSLLSAIRSGYPVRIAWGTSAELRDGTVATVEHSADPVFVTIVDRDHVVVQLPEHIAQQSYHVIDEARFGPPSVMWRGMMATTGSFDAVWIDRATGEEVRRLPQRAAIAWFALMPGPDCRQNEALELAIPGGVSKGE